jgi:hypothetical protein
VCRTLASGISASQYDTGPSTNKPRALKQWHRRLLISKCLQKITTTILSCKLCTYLCLMSHLHWQHQGMLCVSQETTAEPCLYVRVNLHFPTICNIFSGPFNFPIYIMYCLPWFCIPKTLNFSCGLHLESTYKGNTERLLVSTCFVKYYCPHPLVSLRRIFILLYRTKTAFACQSQKIKDNWQCPMVGETLNGTPCKLVF